MMQLVIAFEQQTVMKALCELLKITFFDFVTLTFDL